jgi:hypothetical protein
MAPLGPTATRAEAALLIARGDLVRGTALLRQALDGFDRLGLPLDSAFTSRTLAGALDEIEPDGALESRARAEDIERRLGVIHPPGEMAAVP